MATDTVPEIVSYLRERNLIPDGPARTHRLTGGVSSDLHAVIPANGMGVVVKRALDKLLVQDDWRADTSRNRYEVAWFRTAATIPGLTAHLPRILHDDPEHGLFVMEYLGGAWSTWKAELLSGRLSAETATLAGSVLGTIHAATFQQPECARDFPNAALFEELRLAPYLRTTATRVPAVAESLLAEVERLANCRLALVHGDFSPKNLLVSPGRLIVLDAEVATCGDPAFDLAFVVNHLLLKAVRSGVWDGHILLVRATLEAYRSSFPHHANEIEARAVRLQTMLMLARLWGKSPVEYLQREDPCGRALTAVLQAAIPDPPRTFAGWCDHLSHSRIPVP